jgi:Cu2+-exporting ATPase
VLRTPHAVAVEPQRALACHHCAAPVGPGAAWRGEVAGAERTFCCAGCLAVAQTIDGAGLCAFYEDRTGPALSLRTEAATPVAPAARDDAIAMRAGWLRARADGTADAALLLEGLACGACVWLLETWLIRQPGVLDVRVNLALRRAEVRIDPARTTLGGVLDAVARVGLRAYPYDPAAREASARREGRALMRRTALALLAMMQVMMLALPVYLGEADVARADRTLLEWASLTLTLPVVLYCALPFFAGAWRDLRRGRVGMDVPVAAAIAAAFLGSLVSTVRGAGATYYDSIGMFVALLLLARLLEHGARERAARALDVSARMSPLVAQRCTGWPESALAHPVAADELREDDVVRVSPGAVIPADGVVIEGRGDVDESWLTGESTPRPRAPGDAVLAGAINRDGLLLVRVRHAGPATQIAWLARLVTAAASERPPLAQAADRVAGWFAAAMLGFAAATALAWLALDPSRALAVTFAVLAVSCPCALSLATPAALTAAAGALARRRIVLTRPAALETLARVDHVAFDKTGTLTRGELALVAVVPVQPIERIRALAIAAALERGSEHPVGKAALAASAEVATALDVRNVPGEGVEGTVDGARWRMGRLAFAAFAPDAPPLRPAGMPPGCTLVALGNERGVAAFFAFSDVVRAEAASTVRALSRAGVRASMLSGDRSDTARALADEAEIEDARGDLRPDAKRRAIAAWQAEGECVAMVGDGINDAPALAIADVGISLGSATPLAQCTADLVVLSGSLADIPAALATARRTRRIVRQNLGWALVYNVVALPAAACGLVTPLAASAGMALSSLVVVANALRAGR